MSERPEMPIILASGSSTRRQLLAGAGIAFTVQPADVDEDALRLEMAAGERCDPMAVAKALAAAKAVAVSKSASGALVIGADQILELAGEIITKSTSRAEARRTLIRMSGQSHSLHSALAIARDGQVVWQICESAQLTMRALSDVAIDAYLDQAGPGALSSVGAYQIEGPGILLFERIEGDYFTILGLPLLPLVAALRREGAVPA